VNARVCEYRHCDASIDHRRPNAKHCCDEHKRAESRARKSDPPGTTYPLSKPSETVRRASRDGCGTKLYLTREDVRYLAARDDAPPGLAKKVDRAARRLVA